MNGDVVARFYFGCETYNVPIRQANAAMACGMANRAGLIRSVDADAFLI